MSTVVEIESVLPKLTTEELRRVEEAVHQQYRQRQDGIVCDDSYGVVTETDTCMNKNITLVISDPFSDYQGRRIQKVVSTWNSSSSSYVEEYTDNYAYDGWNCLAILNSSLSLLNSFLWGSDLSGSMQGAGGVGG